jgi:transposase
LTDRGYDIDASRDKIAERGPYANIRQPSAPRIEKSRYKVEHFFNRIKHYRAIATRNDKQDANFLASTKLDAIRIWIGFNESVA